MNLLAEGPFLTSLIWSGNLLIQVTVIACLAVLLARLWSRRAVLAHGILLCGLWLVITSPLSSGWLQSNGLKLFYWPSSTVTEEKAVHVEWPEMAVEEAGEMDQAGTPQLNWAQPVTPAPGNNHPVQAAEGFLFPMFWMVLMARMAAFGLMATVVLALGSFWVGGIALLTLRFVARWFRLSALIRKSEPVRNPEHLRILEQAAAKAGLTQAPGFCESANLSGPIAVGLFRQRVVVPKGFLRKVDSRELGELLLHELAHLARRDQLELFLQHLMAIVFWFHPAVHWLNRRLARSREEICDNHVLSVTDGKSYSRTLLRVAELATGQKNDRALDALDDLPLDAGVPHFRPA